MTATMLAAPILLSNDLLTGAEWNPPQTRELLHLAADIKAHPARYASTLRGKFIALIFEKPSLRTRVTFEVGIQSMGGSVDFSGPHAGAAGRTRMYLRRGAQPGALGARHRRARLRTARPGRIGRQHRNSGDQRALRSNFIPARRLADFLTIEEKLARCADSSWPTSATATMFATR